ncbi:internalin [Pseudoalteromonas fuliginea]|uniref:Internalin n=1 Tax=Pseudoalteromonas fuliginea TaxID=1872678 RepID=A0ABQ6RHD8_9GAMM|nr:internalin [Pseudoalteromonas fuliginea]KAA1155799.1 internalin [Pseudoalteromonas fuliginea]KAA1167024.1 internalin [Pseudoalteromonas fuliginea]
MKFTYSPLARAMGVAVFFACSFSTAAEQIGNFNFATQASNSDLDSVTLGTAYHSEKEGFYALQSVFGQVDETYGNTEMDFVVGVDMSYSQLSSMLDGNLGAALDVPVIKVGVGASYAKQNTADNYTGTYTLFLSLKPKKRLLVADPQTGFKPTQAALDLANANPGDKFNNIGNEFVSAIEYGSQVMINLKFQYKNDEDKVKWGGQLGVDWAGKVNVSGKLQKVDEDVKRNIKITVSALQFGGDPIELLKVIPNQLVNCTMENPTPCFDVFKNSINYIKTNYVAQFDTLDKYNVGRVLTQSYTDSGPSLSPLVPDDVYPAKSILTKLALKNMSDDWVQAILDNRRADNVLNYYASELNNSHRTALETIRDNSLFNSFILADAVDFCKRNPIGNYCRDRELQTRGRVHQYDRKWLEL